MKVLLVTHIYPPAIDGGSKVIFKLGQYFQNQGHQLLVLTSDCHSTDDFSRVYQPVSSQDDNIYRLPVITFFHRPLKLLARFFPFLKPLAKGPIFHTFSFFQHLNRICHFQPDLIVAGPLPTSIVLYAQLIRRITGAKLLVNASFHPTDPDFQAPPLIKSLKSADYIWTLTDYETNYFQKHFQIAASKLINVGSGIDSALLIKNFKFKTKNSNNLLFIGSFAAHKGIGTLLQSLQYLPQVKIVLAGQTTLFYSQLKKQIDSLPPNLKKNVSLFISPSDRLLTTLIDQSQILILPSRQESFGLVLLEAWARGKPVITSDIPQLQEMISKTQGGLTFRLDQPQDLSRQISRLLSSSTLRQKLGKNGFDYVKNHYSWDKIGESLCSKIGC